MISTRCRYQVQQKSTERKAAKEDGDGLGDSDKGYIDNRKESDHESRLKAKAKNNIPQER